MAKPKKDKPLKSSSQPSSSSSKNGSKIWSDQRFAHLVNDPRFKGIPRTEKKVKIDKRFQSMFSDERFNVKHVVDKYGRKVQQKSESEELRKYYELGSEEEEEEGEEKDKDESGSEVDSLELDEEEKAMTMSDKVKNRLEDLEVDYARGEGAIASDSSSDDDSEEEQEDGDEVFIEHVWGELDADAEHTEESTKRLALCNIDWDRVRAVDIMVMLSSFLPRGSAIMSVTIYPSEFGKERMAEEEARGPQELTGAKSDGDSSDSEEDEVSKKEKQIERLREYQLNRLKYYYAVVECDTVATADKLYKECDGVEYESTANKIDLRFIPDEMEFDEGEVKERCTELPEIGKYEPRIFTTTALNQAKVELTWDENDVERKEFNEKIRAGKLTDLTDTDLKRYIKCSSSEDEEDEDKSGEEDSEEESDEEPKGKKLSKQDRIAQYKALLGDLKEQEEKEKEDKVEMEFTWKVNGDEEKQESDDESDGEKKRSDDVNPFEKILEKAKEKKKRRKELKKKKKRGELNSDGEEQAESSDDDLPYGVDLNDPFFASAFDEKEFDLKKPSKKDKKKKKPSEEDEDEEEAARKRAELELILDDGEDDKSHFNLKRIQESEIDLKNVSKSKRKRILKKTRKQIEEQRVQNAAAAAAVDDFDIDLADDRFKAVYERPEFSIDPTNPSFKKTKGMERLIEEKLKKRPLKEGDVPAMEAKKPKKDVSTTLLVKSIKRKIGK